MEDSDCRAELGPGMLVSRGRRQLGRGGPEDSPPLCEKASCVSESEESLSLLADVALAPPGGGQAARGRGCQALGGQAPGGQARPTERSLQSMQLQLQFLMSKSDDLHDHLVNGRNNLDRDSLAAALPNFLYTCQPYFNHLESTARSTGAGLQRTSLSYDICTRLLDFSQQLCDRLEQLVLTYASYSLLCLDETEPNSVSHFCIGQSQLGRLKLTMFRYCKPTPYLARVDTGLYKRMRWNVERLQDKQQQQLKEEEQSGESEEEAQTAGDTEYYFLCYEDITNSQVAAEGNSQGMSPCSAVRMWSIGRWVQVEPDPATEDIFDWIMCEVPQATYHRLLFLGSDEPSSCSATDYLQQLLLSHQMLDV